MAKRVKIRFIGREERTNSVGTFKPGKTYHVSEGDAKLLLSVPRLFAELEKERNQSRIVEISGIVEPDEESDSVVDVEADEDPENDEEDEDEAYYEEYGGMNLDSLRSLCYERGIKGMGKAKKQVVLDALVAADKDETEE